MPWHLTWPRTRQPPEINPVHARTPPGFLLSTIYPVPRTPRARTDRTRPPASDGPRTPRPPPPGHCERPRSPTRPTPVACTPETPPTPTHTPTGDGTPRGRGATPRAGYSRRPRRWGPGS